MNKAISNKAGSLTERVLQLHAVLCEESGQDLIEYALVVALIAGMNSLAGGINTAFITAATSLSNAIT